MTKNDQDVGSICLDLLYSNLVLRIIEKYWALQHGKCMGKDEAIEREQENVTLFEAGNVPRIADSWQILTMVKLAVEYFASKNYSSIRKVTCGEDSPLTASALRGLGEALKRRSDMLTTILNSWTWHWLQKIYWYFLVCMTTILYYVDYTWYLRKIAVSCICSIYHLFVCPQSVSFNQSLIIVSWYSSCSFQGDVWIDSKLLACSFCELALAFLFDSLLVLVHGMGISFVLVQLASRSSEFVLICPFPLIVVDLYDWIWSCVWLGIRPTVLEWYEWLVITWVHLRVEYVYHWHVRRVWFIWFYFSGRCRTWIASLHKIALKCWSALTWIGWYCMVWSWYHRSRIARYSKSFEIDKPEASRPAPSVFFVFLIYLWCTVPLYHISCFYVGLDGHQSGPLNCKLSGGHTRE